MKGITSSNSISFKKPKEYKLDETKITSLDDVVAILIALDVKVHNNFTNFEKIEPYLKELK